jgi:superfamily II DNA or RNA helicase
MTNERRFFNSSERIALYVAADGKCENCGLELPSGWHADHVHAWARGGATDVANGQALCAGCNLRKGDHVKAELELRDCQQAALSVAMEKFSKASSPGRPIVVMLAKSVGSGKTIGTGAICSKMIALHGVTNIVIVSPTKNVQKSWAEVLSRKFNLDIRVPQSNAELAGLRHGAECGYSTTYASVESSPIIHRRLAGSKKTLLVLEECHHIGFDIYGNPTKWAEKILEAFFGVADYVILLSGTPGRTDGGKIPFAEYDENEKLKMDYAYSYGRAVDDGVVRRASCLPVNAKVDVELEGEIYSSSTAEDKSSLRTIVEREALGLSGFNDLKGSGAWHIIARATEELDRIRKTHPRAACLVVCDDINHANQVADMIRRSGRSVVVVHGDVPSAQKHIESLVADGAGGPEFIVAVQLIAEGVDIPRIRVVALLTRRATDLALTQIMGRAVRLDYRTDKNKDGEPMKFSDDGELEKPGLCFFVHLDKKEIMDWAEALEKEIEAESKEKKEPPDDGPDDPPPPPPPPLPDYRVIGIETTDAGETLSGSHYEHEVAGPVLSFFGRRPDLADRPLERAMLLQFSEYTRTTAIGQNEEQVKKADNEDSRSHQEQRDELRFKQDKFVKRFCYANGRNFQEVNKWANEQVGIFSVTTASLEQLRARQRVLDKLASNNGRAA